MNSVDVVVAPSISHHGARAGHPTDFHHRLLAFGTEASYEAG